MVVRGFQKRSLGIKPTTGIGAIVNIWALVDRHNMGIVGFFIPDNQPRLDSSPTQTLRQLCDKPLRPSTLIGCVNNEDFRQQRRRASLNRPYINGNERKSQSAVVNRTVFGGNQRITYPNQ